MQVIGLDQISVAKVQPSPFVTDQDKIFVVSETTGEYNKTFLKLKGFTPCHSHLDLTDKGWMLRRK
jgi:hypothetical protein